MTAILSVQIILATTLVTPPLVAQIKLWTDRSQNAVFQAMLMPRADFTAQTVLTLCRRVLNEENRTPLVSLKILTDEKQQFDMFAFYDLATETLARRCASAVESEAPIAELTSLRGDSIVRIREGRKTQKVVLAGSDPLQRRIDNVHFEIVHLLPTKGLFPLIVYVRAESPDALSHSERLFRSLQGSLQINPIQLVVRNDGFFLRDGVIFPCWWSHDHPDFERIRRGPEVHCARYQPDEAICTPYYIRRNRNEW